MGLTWSRPSPEVRRPDREDGEERVHRRHLFEQVDQEDPDTNPPVSFTCGRKRVRSGELRHKSPATEDEQLYEFLHTPKKRKLGTTSGYIYDQLFVQGADSDVSLHILGKEFRVHKLYLSQSPYFSSMFSGRWMESTMRQIRIQVVDPNISLKAIHVALGSLYSDEICVEPADVIPILATATLFQLEHLMEQCFDMMQETRNAQTILQYYDAALVYGAVRVKQSCLSWLKVNLLHHMPEQLDRLREMSPELMVDLISAPELFVMQTEFSVYVLLRLWLFLLFHPQWQGNPQDAVLQSHKFFQERFSTSKVFFLDSAEGQSYVKVYAKLRFHHLVTHHMDMDMLLSDCIIPPSWMHPIYQAQWQTLLRTDQGVDNGPKSLSAAQFDELCLRCGRTLNTPGQQHMWRWTGFNMGLDLIITFDNWTLSMKRSLGNTMSAEHEALLSNHKKRHIYFRVSVVSLNDQKQVTYHASSGIQSACFGRNYSHQLLKVDPTKATFPLLLSFNFAVSTPLPALPALPPQPHDDLLSAQPQLRRHQVSESDAAPDEPQIENVPA